MGNPVVLAGGGMASSCRFQTRHEVNGRGINKYLREGIASKYATAAAGERPDIDDGPDAAFHNRQQRAIRHVQQPRVVRDLTIIASSSFDQNLIITMTAPIVRARHSIKLPQP